MSGHQSWRRGLRWTAAAITAAVVAASCSSADPTVGSGTDPGATTSSSAQTNPLETTSTSTTESALTGFHAPIAKPTGARGPFAAYANAGALADPSFYPIGVWWQYPWQAAAYRDMGVNTYIWPDSVGNMCGAEARSSCLEGIIDAGMNLVVYRDEYTTAPAVESSVIAWFTCDEPDIIEFARKNCGSLGVTYDEVIIDLAAADPTRPLYTNFSDGLARPEVSTGTELFDLNWLDGLWDSSNPADDPDPGPAESGADFLSDLLPVWCESSAFKSTDAYWFSSDSRQGPIWYYGRNVRTAHDRCGADHPIMNAVETAAQGTSGTGTPVDPQPADVMAMVYSSVAAGASGILYFPQRTDNGGSVQTGSTFLSNPHSFDVSPEITDPAMYETLSGVNHTLEFLGPVLNSGRVERGFIDLAEEEGVVDVLVKRYQGEVFIVAITREGAATLEVDLGSLGIDGGVAYAVNGTGGDEREIAVEGGVLADDLAPLVPVIYRVTPP
ncbi:MAG: hypothetical protein GY713_11000 [Actinomycetia bacterium]|nr:hypothetical protein [Actinomycetes bacterium]